MLKIVKGDITKQDVDVIVNAWNQNFLPYWLLIPQGTSRAIKKVTGTQPFRELSKRGYLKLGNCHITSGGKSKFTKIIHVAGINWIWMATEYSVRESVRTSFKAFKQMKLKSIAYPLIGAGTGGVSPEDSQRIISEEVNQMGIPDEIEVKIVIYKC